ncbi:MAG: hypothetical protein AAFY56_08010 [Pseudomonadota bacterium]
MITDDDTASDTSLVPQNTHIGLSDQDDGEHAPFLIYTLQRTGGTNLTQRLNRRSPFKMAQHEPFNQPRVYGDVTRAWKETRDLTALRSAIDAICAKRENIKHCVEMVPWKITETLIESAEHAGYRHLFLARRDRARRLLSMEYAQRTKVWGPSHTDKVAFDTTAFEVPLNVDELVAHEERCVKLLNKTWEILRSHDVKPAYLIYEDVYGPNFGTARDHLGIALRYLGLSRGTLKDTKLTEALRSEGDQHTRDRYGQFRGVEALRERISALPSFAFEHEPVVEAKP